MKPTSFEQTAGSVGLSPDELQQSRGAAENKIAANTGLPTLDLSDPNTTKQALAANLPMTSSAAGVRPMGADDATIGAFHAIAGAVDNERTLAAYYAGIQANRRIAPVVGYAKVFDHTTELRTQMGLPTGPGTTQHTKTVPVRWGSTLRDSLQDASDLETDRVLYFADKVANSLTFGAIDAAATGDWARGFEQQEPAEAKTVGQEAEVASLAAWVAMGGPIMRVGEKALSPITAPIGKALYKVAGEPLGRFLSAGLKKIYKPAASQAVHATEWFTQAINKAAAESPAMSKIRDRVLQFGGKFLREGDAFKIHLPASTPETVRQETADLVRTLRNTVGGDVSRDIRITSKVATRERLEEAAGEIGRTAFAYGKMGTELAAASSAVPALVHAGKSFAVPEEEANSEREMAGAYVKAAPQIWWETEKALGLYFFLPHVAGKALATPGDGGPDIRIGAKRVIEQKRQLEAGMIDRRLVTTKR